MDRHVSSGWRVESPTLQPMGVNVELRQHGRKPRRGRPPSELLGEIIDWDDDFVRLLDRVCHRSHTPTLDRIDPYGDLVVSGAEAADLLDELPILRTAAAAGAEETFVSELDRLARRCAANPTDHHLHFIGDWQRVR